MKLITQFAVCFDARLSELTSDGVIIVSTENFLIIAGGVDGGLDSPVPSASAGSASGQVIGRHQGLEVFFHGVAVCAREFDDLPDGDFSVFLGEFQDLNG